MRGDIKQARVLQQNEEQEKRQTHGGSAISRAILPQFSHSRPMGSSLFFAIGVLRGLDCAGNDDTQWIDTTASILSRAPSCLTFTHHHEQYGDE